MRSKPIIRIRFVVILTILLAEFCYAEQPYSAGWLEKGCLLIVSKEQTKAPMSEIDATHCLSVSFFITGYLAGIRESSFMRTEDEQQNDSPPLANVPQQWLVKPAIPASLILVFINTHREQINSSSPAMTALTSWYLSAHPTRSGFHMALSDVLLNARNQKAASEKSAGK